MQRIATERALSDALRADLTAALKEYKEKYVAEKAAAA
jgi:hypothetical protein